MHVAPPAWPLAPPLSRGMSRSDSGEVAGELPRRGRGRLERRAGGEALRARANAPLARAMLRATKASSLARWRSRLSLASRKQRRTARKSKRRGTRGASWAATPGTKGTAFADSALPAACVRAPMGGARHEPVVQLPVGDDVGPRAAPRGAIGAAGAARARGLAEGGVGLGLVVVEHVVEPARCGQAAEKLAQGREGRSVAPHSAPRFVAEDAAHAKA